MKATEQGGFQTHLESREELHRAIKVALHSYEASTGWKITDINYHLESGSIYTDALPDLPEVVVH